MKKLILAVSLLSACSLYGQYANSACGSTTCAAELNSKPALQTGSGAPSSLNCTVGKDQYTDTATGDLYGCIITGTPGTWERIAEGAVNSQTANYTTVAADTGKLIRMNGSSLTLTLPASPPFGRWHEYIQNMAASNLTISRNGLTINGGTSNITLPQYGIISVWTDNTNYDATVPFIAGSNITLTPGASGLTIASSGGAGSGCIPAGSSGQLLTDNGSGGCSDVTTLPTASEPAHTGDATNTAGSLAMSVVKVNGLAVPVSAPVLATNSSGQFTNAAAAIAQKFFGTSSPGSVAGNLPGDTFTDTTNHNAYVCNAPSGTGAPACTSVATAGWLLLNGSGGGGDTVTSPNATLNVGGSSSNTTLDAKTTLIAQKFFGTGAPGSVATNLPGDTFTDTTNHNAYVCNAPSGTSAPACTSVATAGWLLLNGAGSGGDVLSTPNSTMNLGGIATASTIDVKTTLIAQKFFGTGAPGSVATNLPGDTFTDTTNHNAYVCNAPSGTAAPACTSVATAGWLLLNGGGGGGDTITSPNGTLAVGGSSSATTLDVVNIDGIHCVSVVAIACTMDDFLVNAAGAYSGLGSSNWIGDPGVGGGSAWTVPNSVVNHPGLVEGQTGGTINVPRWMVAEGGTAVASTDNWGFTGLATFYDNATPTTNLHLNARFGLTTTGVAQPGTGTSPTWEPQNGCWLEAKNTTVAVDWFLVCANSGSFSTADTGVSNVAGWSALEIFRVSSTTIGAKVASTLAGLASATIACITSAGSAPGACTGTTTTSSSNIPSGNFNYFLESDNTEALNKDAVVDLLMTWVKGLTR